MSLEICNQSRSPIPIRTSIFLNIKEKILGKSFFVSLAFIGDKKSRELNQAYRQKNYIPNVLSFPLEKNAGEIFLNLNQCKKEYKKFNMNYKNYVLYLFTHACLHLKGFDTAKKWKK